MRTQKSTRMSEHARDCAACVTERVIASMVLSGRYLTDETKAAMRDEAGPHREQAVTWGGCWRIETSHGTVFFVDFDDAEYWGERWMRVPGEGRGSSQYDHRWNRLGRISRSTGREIHEGLPVVGEGMTIGISAFDENDWWHTTEVTRIERIGRDALPDACIVCFHPTRFHESNPRLPGGPVACLVSTRSFDGECGCDGTPANSGRTTLHFYDRIDDVLGPDTARDWWLSRNDDGVVPFDLLATGRMDDLEAAVARTEQTMWGGGMS